MSNKPYTVFIWAEVGVVKAAIQEDGEQPQAIKIEALLEHVCYGDMPKMVVRGKVECK